MKFIDHLTETQWYRFCDIHVSQPIALNEADLKKSFVYWRRFGVFYVPMGYHQATMAFLLAVEHGCNDGIDVQDKLGLYDQPATADYWMENTPGAAFLSSVSSDGKILVGKASKLTTNERYYFKNFHSLFD